MAKLRDMSRATFYLTCLPGWRNMRVTSKQNVPRVAETRNVSIVSQSYWRVSRDLVFDVSPRMAKHASDKQATCPPSRGDKKCFYCLPELLACLSLQILSRAAKFMWLNWETSREHVERTSLLVYASCHYITTA